LSNASTTVFFRDDDVGRLTPALRDVMALLVEEGVPCSYQVVPAFLDREAADYLRSIQARHPELIRLHQHGHRHEQVLGGERVYSEFAGGRPLAEQQREIEAGRRILEDLLGPAFDPELFTPPCHKYDDATVAALDALGFRMLSAGVKADPLSQVYYGLGARLRRIAFLGKRVSYHGGQVAASRLLELSVCVDVDEDKDERGQRIEKDDERLWAEFERCRRRLPIVGIMLHHACSDRPQKLDWLRAFVHRLKADPGVRLASIPEIAAALQRPPKQAAS
jgi:hypothetical protein